MAVVLSRSPEEIQELPLVELAWEILRQTKEPFYFRDLMAEIQNMRQMSENEVAEIIARLYTEINIDGRFLCIGNNVWGLKRWYPVDRVAEKAVSKKFVRRPSGDAFSDEDEDLDDDFDDPTAIEEDDDINDDLDAESVAGEEGDDEDDVDDVPLSAASAAEGDDDADDSVDAADPFADPKTGTGTGTGDADADDAQFLEEPLEEEDDDDEEEEY